MPSSLPTHRPCVSVIILRPRAGGWEVLLVHKPRKRDTWQIPQGGIEEGETVEEAGKRELLEETNINITGAITKCPQFYQYDYPRRFKNYYKPKYNGQHLAFTFAVVSQDTVVTVDQRELDAFEWVRPKHIRKFLKRRSYRKRVHEAIEWAKEEMKTPSC